MELGQWTIEVFPARACGMEAGAEPQHRMQVNPFAGFSDLGQRAFQRDARYPIGVEEY